MKTNVDMGKYYVQINRKFNSKDWDIQYIDIIKKNESWTGSTWINYDNAKKIYDRIATWKRLSIVNENIKKHWYYDRSNYIDYIIDYLTKWASRTWWALNLYSWDYPYQFASSNVELQNECIYRYMVLNGLIFLSDDIRQMQYIWYEGWWKIYIDNLCKKVYNELTAITEYFDDNHAENDDFRFYDIYIS